MSNSNTNLQTQSSNALHNAINVGTGSKTTTERYMENYKNVSQDIRDQLNAEAEAVQIILTGIDNDIYSTVDACPNACEINLQTTNTTLELTSSTPSSQIQDHSPRSTEELAYHKEKMLLCKQEEAEVQLNAEQADWKDDTDDESEEQNWMDSTLYSTCTTSRGTPDSVDNSYQSYEDEPMP
ncbi:hypothetical protein Tco_0869661 [Tanacetum coccineum]